MARTSLDAGSSKPAPKKASTKGSSLDRAQMIKLSVSIGVILLVIVWLLFQFELISFGGSGSDVPEVTPEQAREFEEQRAKDEAMRLEAERNPSAPRPPPVGSQ